MRTMNMDDVMWLWKWMGLGMGMQMCMAWNELLESCLCNVQTNRWMIPHFLHKFILLASSYLFWLSFHLSKGLITSELYYLASNLFPRPKNRDFQQDYLSKKLSDKPAHQPQITEQVSHLPPFIRYPIVHISIYLFIYLPPYPQHSPILQSSPIV